MIRRLLAVVVLLVALAGCTRGEVLELRGDELPGPTCESVTQIPVDELDTPERPTCNPLGSTLLFPGGETIDIGDGGGSTESSDSDVGHAYSNVGSLGVLGIEYSLDCSTVRVWGRAEAIEKVRRAFGDDYGVC